MKHLKFFILVLVCALLMALLEVQIEGTGGWAANLPTWRKILPIPILGLVGFLEKPLTGYHLYLWLMLFILPHFAFILTKWSFKTELLIISFYAFFTTLEGLLWFVVNPTYGLGALINQRISWYQEAWFLGLPVEYWWRLSFSFVIYFWANVDQKTKVNQLSKLQK